MANWSLCGRHAGPGKPPMPIFINLDNVFTLERQDDVTNGYHGWWRKGLHRHHAGNADWRCCSSGSCVGPLRRQRAVIAP